MLIDFFFTLRAFHPAYQLVRSSYMILLGFVVGALIRTATREPIPFDILVRDLERIRDVLEDNDLEAALQAAQLIVAPASVPSAPWPTA